MPSGRYIQVILPLRLEWEPCYCLPEGEKARVGQRVLVPLSGKRYVGVVSAVDVVPDIDPSRILPVTSTGTGLEDITEDEISFWRWMASYYLCTVGEVYKAAYPSAKLLGEETVARSRQRRDALREKTMALYMKRLSALQDYLSRKQASLGKHANPETKVHRAIVARIESLKLECEALRKKISALEAGAQGSADLFLNSAPAKKKASKPLLFLSSEREDRYILEARKEMESGRSVLILVPEIKRASILKDRLGREFGTDLLLFHSKLTQAGRRSVAEKLREGRPCVVLGTRSSLFLPFGTLGLVIVDDEQDPSYKVSDGAPRYNCRDSAIALASSKCADVILGSVCPSLESSLNAVSGKYRLEDARSGIASEAEIIDVKAEKRKRGMDGPLSFKLRDAVSETVASGKKAVLLAPSWLLDELGSRISASFPGSGLSIRISNINTSKWLEEDNVGLVAILGADSMLSREDFRADERALQILSVYRSVSPEGRFIIQTSRSDHPVYNLSSDTEKKLLAERKAFSFPPYTRLVDVRCPDASIAGMLQNALDPSCNLLAMPDKVRIFLPRDPALASRKETIRRVCSAFEKQHGRKVPLIIDVDPA